MSRGVKEQTAEQSGLAHYSKKRGSVETVQTKGVNLKLISRHLPNPVLVSTAQAIEVEAVGVLGLSDVLVVSEVSFLPWELPSLGLRSPTDVLRC